MQIKMNALIVYKEMFFFCLTLDGATYSKNKWKLSSDEDDVDLKVMKLLVVMIKVIRMK
jgi:hypothetical protein